MEEETLFGFFIPRTVQTKIVKSGARSVRLYVGPEWIKELDEDGRDKLAIGLRYEPPGQIVIARELDFNRRGYKTRRLTDGTVFFTATVGSRLVSILFPDDENRVFIPKNVEIFCDSDGRKGIALEWDGIQEVLNSQETQDLTERDSEDLSVDHPDDSHDPNLEEHTEFINKSNQESDEKEPAEIF